MNSFAKNWDKHSKSDIINYQNEALSKYISKVVHPASKHYQRIFKEENISPDKIRSIEDLKYIPLTSKDDLIVTPEAPERTKELILIPDEKDVKKRFDVIIRALLRGKAYAQNYVEREYRPIFMTSTTGRSAEPTPFFFTQKDIKNLSIAGSRVMDVGGCVKDDRILNMFPYAPHLAYWLTHYAATEKNVFCISSGGGKVMGTEGNIRLMEKIKPSILVAMPTFIYHVLQEAIQCGIKVDSIRRIVLGGEKVPEGTKSKLAELCEKLGSPNVQVTATYGFTEAKLAFGECPIEHGKLSGFHLYPDLGIVEIVDPETGEVQPEGCGGEIVFTPLEARGTVILRYRTGDLIENGITYEPCPFCGRTMPRLSGKISRVSNIRSMQLRKLKGTLVDFNSLEHLLDDMAGIATWQIELRKLNDDPMEIDELHLHVAKDSDISDDSLRHNINEHFKNAVEITPNAINFHSLDELRTKQQVGKAMKEEKIVDNRAS